MNQQTLSQSSAAEQLRPVVLSVIAANIAVVALLLTTVNVQFPASPVAVEMAELR
jgi:hypothetical protein